MSQRVKILFPKAFTFSMDIPVRISDINYGGHVGNDKILAIAHEARMAFFAQWNFTEMNAGGNSLIMADSAVQYKGEAFYGDNLLVEMCVGEIGEYAFDLFYKITCNRNNQNFDIAFVKTALVCFDYQVRKKLKVNDVLKMKLI